MLAKLVGIINVTPDSFSDGGSQLEAPDALVRIEQLIMEGADIIDIGAESTRPNATPLTHEEEWQRLEPVLQGLVAFPEMIFSIDTYHPETAKKLAAYPISWLNDVSGFVDSRMIEAAKEANVDVVVMHNLGIPADPKVVIAEEEDVVAVVFHWAQEKIQSLTEQGIHKDRVIFDPGIGFGKSTEQSLLLIRNIERFKELGVRLFVGHSRKSFLKPFLKAVDEAERDRLTAEISSYLSAKGIDYIRVHNVTLNKQRLGEAPSLPEGFL